MASANLPHGRGGDLLPPGTGRSPCRRSASGAPEPRLRPGPEDLLEVSEKDGDLRIARPPAAPRVLHFLGDHTFFPAGAEAVRVRFEEVVDRLGAVTIHDPGPLARGVRLP